MVAPRDIPCIMSAPMVLATLREIEHPGTGKTNMRRLAWKANNRQIGVLTDPKDREAKPSPWQKVKPGDRLWVRESLRGDCSGWFYAADNMPVEMDEHDSRVSAMIAWAHHYERHSAPSIHMPRWASRLTLHVTATKIERLLCGSLGDGDAEREGLIRVDYPDGSTGWRAFADEPAFNDPTIAFNVLWDRLHGRGAFFANPDVVAITFRPVLANIDALEARAA